MDYQDFLMSVCPNIKQKESPKYTTSNIDFKTQISMELPSKKENEKKE